MREFMPLIVLRLRNGLSSLETNGSPYRRTATSLLLQSRAIICRFASYAVHTGDSFCLIFRCNASRSCTSVLAIRNTQVIVFVLSTNSEEVTCTKGSGMTHYHNLSLARTAFVSGYLASRTY